MVRRDECEFSNFMIHPGHGRRYVPFAFISTKPILSFHSAKCFAQYKRKKNPRFVAWTRTFRRLNKKSSEAVIAKTRNRKSNRQPRAIVGMDLATIQERRATRPAPKDRSAKRKAAEAEMAFRKGQKK